MNNSQLKVRGEEGQGVRVKQRKEWRRKGKHVDVVDEPTRNSLNPMVAVAKVGERK